MIPFDLLQRLYSFTCRFVVEKITNHLVDEVVGTPEFNKKKHAD